MLLFGNFSLEGLIAVLFAVGIGMTVHEFAHNYVGYLMGDPTPAQEGRLTLNPLVHINWVGWLMFAIIGFGILGQAAISPYRMRNPRWGYLAAVAAGPISNLLLAIAFAIPARLLIVISPDLVFNNSLIWLIFSQTILMNLLLFLFNLIPLFPLDGWHIVYTLLPPDLATQWGSPQGRQYSQYAFFGALLLSFSGIFNVFGILIGQPMFTLYRILLG